MTTNTRITHPYPLPKTLHPFDELVFLFFHCHNVLRHICIIIVYLMWKVTGQIRPHKLLLVMQFLLPDGSLLWRNLSSSAVHTLCGYSWMCPPAPHTVKTMKYKQLNERSINMSTIQDLTKAKSGVETQWASERGVLPLEYTVLWTCENTNLDLHDCIGVEI